MAGVGAVLLGWDGYRVYGSDFEKTPDEGWTIRGWAVSKHARAGGRVGVAVHVFGSLVTSAAPLVQVAPGRWQRWLATAPTSGSLLPLKMGEGPDRPGTAAQRDTLHALCSVLRDRSAQRSTFADAERCRTLAADLAAGCLTKPRWPSGVARDSVDLATAMRQAGFVHEYGRPLGASIVVSMSEAVSVVRRSLAANPHRQGRGIGDEVIESFVGEHFINVKPWPFSALIGL